STQERRVFSPTWRLVEPNFESILGLVGDIAALSDVHAVRLVPSEPPGVVADWQRMEVGWHWGSCRCLMRMGDGLLGHDWVERTIPRPPTPMDRAIEQVLIGGFASQGLSELPWLLIPIADREARRLGMELRLSQVITPGELAKALHAIGCVEDARLLSLAIWAFDQHDFVAWLWCGETGETLPS
ncbi:MAG: hypothetical protein HN348_33235, partial [Proteobacteria bacterium]|nr:hypothetical protein [Pseudomonadota bacterium]